MTGREKRFLVIGAAVAAAAAVGAVYSSIQDGRRLRLDNPLDPLPYIQAKRAERRLNAARAASFRLAQAMEVYTDGARTFPAAEDKAAVGPQKQEP